MMDAVPVDAGVIRASSAKCWMSSGGLKYRNGGSMLL